VYHRKDTTLEKGKDEENEGEKRGERCSEENKKVGENSQKKEISGARSKQKCKMCSLTPNNKTEEWEVNDKEKGAKW